MDMKELDELKEKCVHAMKDVDAFVEEHYDEPIAEMKAQHGVPDSWEARIISNCGVVHGCFRINSQAEWHCVIYNNGEWMENNLGLRRNIRALVKLLEEYQNRHNRRPCKDTKDRLAEIAKLRKEKSYRIG